jgi:hypothetical protein
MFLPEFSIKGKVTEADFEVKIKNKIIFFFLMIKIL